MYRVVSSHIFKVGYALRDLLSDKYRSSSKSKVAKRRSLIKQGSWKQSKRLSVSTNSDTSNSDADSDLASVRSESNSLRTEGGERTQLHPTIAQLSSNKEKEVEMGNRINQVSRNSSAVVRKLVTEGLVDFELPSIPELSRPVSRPDPLNETEGEAASDGDLNDLMKGPLLF